MGFQSGRGSAGPNYRSYRADIDGLRAVAIVSVVLFHSRYSVAPGGFVGVDVFFVISGYLITKLILDHGQGSVTGFLWTFYERRIRRLFPAMVPVLVVTTLLALYKMPPNVFEDYSKSLAAFLTFASNWYFWANTDYFDAPAQTKPLLHTWSLSIEEQFYLLFPAAILFIGRYGRVAVASFVIGVILLSLGYAVHTVSAGEPGAAFFNSFSRFWELALGALLALGIISSPPDEWTKSILGMVGAVMIGVAVFTLDAHAPFPGLNALLPTVGAAAIIMANGGIVGRLLAWRPLVGVGLISYSLYLWHWPIFLFFPGAWNFAYAIALALGLSVVSYFVVEQPVRTGVLFPGRRTLYAAFAAGASAFMLVGVVGAATGGLPQRYGDAAQEYESLRKWQFKELTKAARWGECWALGTAAMQDSIASCVKPLDGKVNPA